jgi:amino acid permease
MDPKYEATNEKVPGAALPLGTDSTYDNRKGKYGAQNMDEYIQTNNRLDVEYNLPITASRTAKWWYSAFHNTTAIVGAGVLGLPQAISFLGWPGGMVVLVLSWVISLYTLHQLVALHEFEGKRFNRYHELGQYAFGKRLGDFAIITPQLIVMIGLGITYSVTGGQSLYRFWGFTCPKTPEGNCKTAMGQSAWIVVFGAIQLVFIQCPNFNALSIISFSAAVMSLMYSTIAIGGSIKAGKQPDAVYNLDGQSTAKGVFNAFNALGIIAFAYGGHNVVLEIQATMPSPPATYRPYMRGVYVAYAVLTWCYAGVGITGYHAFGNKVASNILFSINKPVWMVCLALFAVFIHVVGSFQVYTMPVMDMIEMQMVKRGIPNGLPSRLIYRSIYVVLITFVAVSIPFFGSLMGFIGALGTGPTTFFLPSIIWLVLKKPKVTNWNFWASWICIILGGAVTILGSIGGMRDIIVSADGFTFYNR